MTKYKKYLILIFVLIVLFCLFLVLYNTISVGCIGFTDCKEELISSDSYLYSFNPEMINNNENDVLFRLLEDGSDYPKHNFELMSQPEDLLQIIGILIDQENYLQNDDLKISSLNYHFHCDQIEEGMYDAWITYGTINTNNQSRLSRSIQIDFSSGFVEVSDALFSPVHNGNKYIENLNNLIDAKDVLNIAENAYGREFRKGISNQCDIQVLIGGITNDTENWEISYHEYESEEFTSLTIKVNAKNGEIISIENN